MARSSSVSTSLKSRMVAKNYSLADYWKGVLAYAEKHPAQRYGQAAFNYLDQVRPDLSGQVRGSTVDPFYVSASDHPVMVNFSAFLQLNW